MGDGDSLDRSRWAPLSGSPPGLRRGLGVTVSEPYRHATLGQAVTVYTETLNHLTDETGRIVAAEEAPAAASEAARRVIARIDEDIAELQRHRARLVAGLGDEVGESQMRLALEGS